MKDRLLRKGLVVAIIVLFVGTSIIPSINGTIEDFPESDIDERNQQIASLPYFDDLVNISYIYNITKKLSDIIFNETLYNESAGEIAKGRAFGSAGERAAAKILAVEMEKLGLYDPTEDSSPAYQERIKNITNSSKPPWWKLKTMTHGYEALEYNLTIRNGNYSEFVDCEITPIIKGFEITPNKNETIIYKDLKIIQMPRNLSTWINASNYERSGKNYVFIDQWGTGGVRCRNPNASLSLIDRLLRCLSYPIRIRVGKISKNINDIKNYIKYKSFNNYTGIIYYDFTDDTHHTGSNTDGRNKTHIYINGTTGRRILEDIENYRVDFSIKQRYNTSIISHNVIGQINGTKYPCKKVIVCSLYDSAQCQGTADSAIGMAIVLGVAKYFMELKTKYNITPMLTIKFIGFGGEEAGNRGAKYYATAHRKEDIKYVIDINQVGFYQKEPKLTLNLIFNRHQFMEKIWEIANRTNYEKRVGYTAEIAKRWWPEGVLSNQWAFNWRCPTVCFLKDFPWVLHHRDGRGHKAGDVIDYFDEDDTEATAEIIINITKNLTLENSQNIPAEHYFSPLDSTNGRVPLQLCYWRSFFLKKLRYWNAQMMK